MYLLFDIGGTNTRLAFSKDGKSFTDEVIYPTPQDFRLAVKELKQRIKKTTKTYAIKVAAGGIAGTLDRAGNKLLRAPNLKLWVNRDLKAELESVFDFPFWLANDADLVGLGEALQGAGKGFDIVAYFTVSTGVGGTRIVQGKIDRGAYSFEPGWQYVYGQGLNSSNRKMYDFLEYFISGTSLAKTYNRPPAAIMDEGIWQRVTQVLAYGLHNSIMHWSPDVIVLGGSVMRSLNCEQIASRLKEISNVYNNLPEIKPVALRNLGGLYGALEYAKQNFRKK